MEIPRLCGSCHREGTTVSLTRQIPQTNILANYMDSIHGEALFKKGLTVAAVCTSCHTAHFVLPHTDPRSSIAKQNISEDVHAVPRADRDRAPQGDPRRALGEAAAHDPGLRGLPLAAQGAQGVLHAGHGRPGLPALPRRSEAQGDPQRADGLAVHEQGRAGSIRATRRSPACSATPAATPPIPRGPAARSRRRSIAPICHAEVVDQYRESKHGQLAAKGSPDAPVCKDCHSPHGTLSKNDSASPTFSRNVPALCATATAPGRRPPSATRARSSTSSSTTWRASTARD